MQLSALQVNIAQEIEGGYNEYVPRKYSSLGLKRTKKINFRYKRSSIFIIVLIFTNHFVRKNPRRNYSQNKQGYYYKKRPPRCYVHKMIFDT